MYIPWFYDWGDGVVFPQPWRKSDISWVVLVDCEVDAFGSCESNSCTRVMAILAPWFSVCLGAASMASKRPGLRCWYCPCCDWLLLGQLFSLCCGQSCASPFFPHLKQRPPACLFRYSLVDKRSSSIVLGSFMGLFSWGISTFGHLTSGFWLVVWSPGFCFLNEKRRSSVVITALCNCSSVLNISHRSSRCMLFFKLWRNNHGSAWFPFIPERSAVQLNSWVWSLHEPFCLISTRCLCILCVSDGSVNFPRNSWASVTGCARPAPIFSVWSVSQWAFHEAALESSSIHARAQAMKTSSFKKSFGHNVRYVVHAVINPWAFSPGVPSNSGLGALIIDRGAGWFWMFWMFWFSRCTIRPWVLTNSAQYRLSIWTWPSMVGWVASAPSAGAGMSGKVTWFWKPTNADTFASPVCKLISSCQYQFTSCTMAVGGVAIVIWGMAHAWGFRLAMAEFSFVMMSANLIRLPGVECRLSLDEESYDLWLSNPISVWNGPLSLEHWAFWCM